MREDNFFFRFVHVLIAVKGECGISPALFPICDCDHSFVFVFVCFQSFHFLFHFVQSDSCMKLSAAFGSSAKRLRLFRLQEPARASSEGASH